MSSSWANHGHDDTGIRDEIFQLVESFRQIKPTQSRSLKKRFEELHTRIDTENGTNTFVQHVCIAI